MKPIYLIANGDLRSDANQKCEAAQAAMEKQLVAAIEKEGASVQRAHPFDPEKKHGFIERRSEYSPVPDIITSALIEDGEKHLFGEQPIETGCPVHVIQGMQDREVPWAHATRLMEHLAFDDAVLTLVRDGDHRLSRPEDIERLIGAVSAMIEG